MKQKILKPLIFLSLITMLNLLFSSCERELYQQPTGTAFSPEEAKEWYYSNLKTTEQFKVSSKNNGDKLPDWKNGAYRKIGDFEMIEFPLMKNKKTFLMTKNNSLSDAEKRRILNASLTRVVFIKNVNNKIELRELNYIPEYKYLASKGFDISGVDLSKEKNDFTGTLIIKTWDSHIVSKRIFSNGKVIATIKFGKNTKTNINSKSSINASTSKTKDCVTYEDQYWEVQCVIVQQGDVWVYTGECTDWVLVWVSAPYEVCDPVDLCADSSDPDCQCIFYGIGCNDGGGDPPADPPADPPKDPCSTGPATTTISQSSSYINANTSITTASADGNEHSITLGKDSSGNITQAPMNNGRPNSVAVNTSWPGAFADIHNHTTDTPPSSGDIYAAVEKNETNSDYTTSFVNVPDGSYAIVVSNLALAQEFVTSYPSETIPGYNPEFPDVILDEIYALRYSMGSGSSVENYMRAVSFLLDKYESGITILKRDSDGNYKAFKVEETVNQDGSKTYTVIPCNN